MPYLQRNQTIDDQDVQARTWVPETKSERDRWRQRLNESGVTTPLPWRRHPMDGAHYEIIPFVSTETEQDKYLKILAADMASAERDGLFYFNMLERLKNAPFEKVADEVVDTMGALGFVSVDWSFDDGGPPPHSSPRPWDRVLDWLLRQLARVGRFLLDCVQNAMVFLAGEGALNVTIQIGVPPSVGFTFESNLFSEQNQARWMRVRSFLDWKLDEIEARTFA